MKTIILAIFGLSLAVPAFASTKYDCEFYTSDASGTVDAATLQKGSFDAADKTDQLAFEPIGQIEAFAGVDDSDNMILTADLCDSQWCYSNIEDALRAGEPSFGVSISSEDSPEVAAGISYTLKCTLSGT